ncbi:MAG: Maf family protein [Deltaproteobacteria bacterium]|nr:Maf family protein [Deltaproteobacteria bacterium]
MHLAVSGRLILASASPRRSELLKLMGLAVEVLPSCIDETPLPGETPREHVLRLAELKALAVAAQQPDAWVLGADTIVTIDGQILGKPGSVAEAKEMLDKLSGREHEVFTGFCIVCRDKGIVLRDAVGSAVLFREITDDELEWYAGSPEPYDKAGGYAVQGIGGFFVREIRGSHSNVVGLPLCEVIDALKRVRAIRFPGGGHDHCR